METKFYMKKTEDCNELIAVQKHYCHEEKKEIKLTLVLPSDNNGYFKNTDLYSDSTIADAKNWIQTLSERTSLEFFGKGNKFVDFDTIDSETLAEIGDADIKSFYLVWWCFEYRALF